MRIRSLIIATAIAVGGLGGYSIAGASARPAQGPTLATLQASVSSLQHQVNALKDRIGNGPATPNISILLDQVTSVVTCLRQNQGALHSSC